MKILHYKRDGFPAGAVNIMRPNPLGNPYEVGRDGTRDEVIALFRGWFLEKLKDRGFRKYLRNSVRGRDLVCCCVPLYRCHGQVIVDYFEKG